MNERLGRTAWRIASSVLTIALLVFAYLYISDLVRKAELGDVRINIGWMVLSFMVFIVSYTFMSLNWWMSGRILKPDMGKRQMLAFLASQPFKYLPTSLFTFSSRAYYGKELGLTLKQSSAAQVFENASLFLSNLILFVVLILAKENPVASILLVSILGFFLTYLYKIDRKISLDFRGRSLNVRASDFIKMLSLTGAGWLISGISFLLLAKSMGIDHGVLNTLAANTIAFSLSMLAFFAPGGIGVRELVYSKFGISNMAIIYWRILVFVVDMVVGAVSIIVIKKVNRTTLLKL